MYTIHRRVGRLVEITIRSPVTLDEAVRWRQDHDAAVNAVSGPYVCFVDVVDATVFPPEVADAYVATMRNEPRLLRTGILLNADPVLALQVQRMVREGNVPTRRTFHASPELEAWLGEVLVPAERVRLSERLTARALERLPARTR